MEQVGDMKFSTHARSSFTALLLGAGCQAHHSYCQQKHYFLHISSWSVSSRGSSLCQDLLKLTVIQFQQINWNLVVQQPAVVVPFAKHASGFGLCNKVRQGLFIHALVSGLIECHIVGTNTLVERWKGLECSPYTS